MHLLHAATSYVQNDNPTTHNFPVKSGLRQGSVEGPPLYNFYSDYALRSYENQKEDLVTGLSIPFSIPNEATNRIRRNEGPASGYFDDSESIYADDSGIFSWSSEELQLCINILVQVFTDFGLKVNQSKTESIIFHNCQSLRNNYPESIISINDTPIKNVNCFKYLGVWLHSDQLSIGQEIKFRVDLHTMPLLRIKNSLPTSTSAFQQGSCS